MQTRFAVAPRSGPGRRSPAFGVESVWARRGAPVSFPVPAQTPQPTIARFPLAPDASGRGLLLTLAPVWGNAANDAEKLWYARDASQLGVAEDLGPEAQLAAELGYGLAPPRTPRVVTPYAGLSAMVGQSRAYRTGARWTVAPDATLELEAARSEGAHDDGPEHWIGLEVRLHWQGVGFRATAGMPAGIPVGARAGTAVTGFGGVLRKMARGNE